MSVFDEMMEKAKQIANVAEKKTSVAVELSKLRLRVVQMNSMIQSNYERIGTMVYEQEKSGNNNKDLIAVCISEIDSLLAELNRITERIAELKRGGRCPVCGAPSTTESLYCPRCGANMKKSAQTRSASETSSWSAQSPGSEPKSESSASQEGADQTTTQ